MILDPDFKDDNKDHFKTIWAEYKKQFPKLSETKIVETPHGFHVYYYMRGFSENRSTNKNRIYINSKKENKRIFSGNIKTTFKNYLTGFDILGNNGYALISPSKLNELTFETHKNLIEKGYEFKTDEKIIKRLIDKRSLSYADYVDNPIMEISKSDFKKIKAFFLLEKPVKMRQPWIDVLNGKIEIHDQCAKTGVEEHLYWKNMFREAWSYCGLVPEEIYSFLTENQPAFDLKETVAQLKYDYHAYKGTYVDREGKIKDILPLTNIKMAELFPSFTFNLNPLANIKLSDLSYKTKSKAEIVNFDEIYEKIKVLNGETTTNDIKEILKHFAEYHVIERKRAFTLLKDNSNLNLNLTDIKDIYKQITKDRWNLIDKKKETSAGENKEEDLELALVEDEIIEQFDFNGNEVEICKDGIYSIEYRELRRGGDVEMIANRLLVLAGRLELLIKTKDGNTELFTFRFRDDLYHTYSRSTMFVLFSAFQYKNTVGKDIVKASVTYLANKLKHSEPRKILGFDDGWVLPHLEKAGNYAIILYTPEERDIYDQCKDIIKSYTKEEIDDIIAKFKILIKKTQADPLKLITIIGWSVASVFRLSFLDYFNLFPCLLLVGKKQSGKTFMGLMFVVYMFGVWKTYLSSSTVQSNARLEDILTGSTFPFLVDELSHVRKDTVEVLKDTLTGRSDYIRKLSVIEQIKKPKVSPFAISTNEVPREFEDSALNSKIITLHFSVNETVKDDQEWIDIFNSLKREKLFSFLYEFTVDWTDKEVIERIRKIEKQVIESGLDKKSRLKKKFVIILFGVELFKDAYRIDLLELLSIKQEELLELLKDSSRNISSDLLDKFIVLCKLAKAFELDSFNDQGNKVRGSNPKFLTCRLKQNNSGAYLFDHSNLRDFKEFSNCDHSLNKLAELLIDSLDEANKDAIKYGVFSIGGQRGRRIRILEEAINTEICLTSDDREPLDERVLDLDIIWYKIEDLYKDSKVYKTLSRDRIIQLLSIGVTDKKHERSIVELVDHFIEIGRLEKIDRGSFFYKIADGQARAEISKYTDRMEENKQKKIQESKAPDIDAILGISKEEIEMFEEILEKIREVSNDNDGKALDISGLIQVIELTTGVDEETIKKAINYFIEDGPLISSQNKIQFK